MKENKKSLNIQKLDLDLAPLEMASQLSHCEGFIFLDSSGNFPRDYQYPLSIVAVNPVKLYQDVGCDFSCLSGVISAYHSDENIPQYIPQGGLFD